MRLRRSLAAPALLASLALLAAGCGGGSGSLPLPQVAPAVVAPPAADAIVDARQWGTRDLAVARRNGTVTVSVVGAEGSGVSGLTVRVGGRRAKACGSGCYRAPAPPGPLTVAGGGRTWRFALPAAAPSAKRLVASAEKAYARLRSVSLVQRIGSGRGAPLVTRFVFVAPDRLRYASESGPQGVVIGTRRWDRSTPSEPWQRSPQDRVHVMHVPWRTATAAHLVAPNTVTFFDTGTRAWFRVVLDPATSLPLTVRMTGISHFMLDRFSGFDEPAEVAAPT